MYTVSFDPELLHITGAFGIHIYGVCVALGLAVFFACTYTSPLRKKYISTPQYDTLLIGSLIAGVIGARFVHVLSEWHTYETAYQMLEVWTGGLSILGAVLGVAVYSIYYLKRNGIPVLPVWDMGALYLPLAQAIARFGCLFTGCCHGVTTATKKFAVMYTNMGSSAPLYVPLIPVQLYSVIWYLALWVLIQLVWAARGERSVAKSNLRGHGQLAMLYLIGSCAERFVLDFFRGDRIIDTDTAILNFQYLSMHQWISLTIMALASLTLVYLSRHRSSGSAKR